jgi:adenine-specific DNA-methyltransferase
MPSLNFKGKALVQNFHLLVPYHELKLVKSKSLTPKVSLHDNLVVHGDNLKALKSLLPYYAGKVKCIYIDPPYNTGNEKWVYNDNVSSPMIQEWLGKVVDREDLTRHDKWLCMMMPRLKLLREFLTDDGVIFVSIDEFEVHRLRCLMDEVFAEENLIATFVRKRRLSTGMRDQPVSPDHEYIVAYARTLERASLSGTKRRAEDYPFEDGEGRYRSTDLTVGMGKDLRPNQFYAISEPKTKNEYWPPETRVWRFEPGTMEKEIKAGNIIWPSAALGGRMTRPRYKTRYSPDEPNENPVSTWIQGTGAAEELAEGVTVLHSGLNQEATRELREIGLDGEFAYPKPVSLVQSLVDLATQRDSIVLDCFAGSGTTGHAVLAANQVDGGSRHFVLIESEDFAHTLAAERLRRVIKGVPKAKDDALQKGLGGSFSFVEVGHPMQLEALLRAEKLPSYEDLASYVFYTATGEDFDAKRINRKTGFIGESAQYDVYLLYEPDLSYLKSTALTLDIARSLPKGSGKKRLVFAPTKYLDSIHLEESRIEFCQLPFEIYKAVKRNP